MNINVNSGNIQNLASIIKGEIVNTQTNATADLMKLLSGDVFSGKILNIINSDVQISVGDGQIINARLADSMNFNIGENVTFQVKENNGAQITIRPVETGNFSLEIISKALTSADLPMSEKNIEVVKELMKNQMPIDKQTINSILNQINLNKGSDVNAIVLMNKFKIPINPENIVKFQDYSNGNHRITSAIENLSNQLPQVVSDMSKSGQIKEAISLSQNISNQLPIDKNLKEFILKLIDSLGLNEKQSAPIKEMINSTKLNLNNIPNETLLKELLMSEEYKNVLKEAMRNEWTIDPKRFIQESIDKPQEMKDLYKSIYEGTDRLLKSLTETSSKTVQAAINNLTNVKSNINFMNSLNHIIPYVQIPIKMQNQTGHGDLYVYNNTKGKQYQEGEEVTAFLHLDLENLGATDVDIRMKDKKVSTNFTLDNDESMLIVEKHLPELKEKLEKRGYKAEYSVEVINNKQSESVMEIITNNIMPNVTIKRYSFDIRA